MASIQFLGAAGTVTGARFLVSTERARVLVDCGLFQGLKQLRLLNWEQPSVDPRSIDAIVLTHAHLDHTGYLPRLVNSGYDGPIYGTPATVDLCGILLPDSGHLQEEQAEHANLHGYSKHTPALPLYTLADANNTLQYLRPCPYNEPREVAEGIRVRLVDAGHILGSAIVEMWVEDGKGETKITFSGDLGRYGEPLLGDPTPIEETDYLLVESTYGDRTHSNGHPERQLEEMVLRAAEMKGCLLIPAFSVGRTQQLLHAFHSMEKDGRFPDMPVYVDSPMAIDATKIFLSHPEAHRVDMRRLESNGENPLRLRQLKFVRTPEESRALDERQGPMVLISASGMATGGRILHHLASYLDDPRATVLFVGYQAEGTRGRTLLDGGKQLKMMGREVPVKAAIRQIDGFSGHADRDEIIRWLTGFKKAPKTAFVIHGEDHASTALASNLQSRFGWKTAHPALHETVELQ